MCYNEFFNSPDMQLPLTRKKHDFLSYMKDVFKAYRDKIDHYDPIIKEQGIQLSEKIIEILQAYLKGYPNQAYEILSNTLTGDIQEWLKYSYDFKTSEMDGVRLYRMRIDRENVSDRKDIFHVPYEKRHIITSQRYSIPGLPCLYLGGSLYTCWLEMERPRLEDVSVAAFHLANGQNIKFLNLHVNPAWVLENNVNNVFMESYIKYWPLFAVCSTRDYIPTANFKPEYIIPQLLLQWVTQNSDIDGIKFFSTYINKITQNPHWCCNYVFPATRSHTRGFCSKLRNKFILTEPYYWQILSSTNMDMGDRYDDNFMIELISGNSERYNFTKFGEVQTNLNYLLSQVRNEHRNDSSFGKV